MPVPDEAVAVVSALVAALFIALGIVVRQRSTRHVPHEHSLSPRMAAALVRQPQWWGGTIAAFGGYGFQALALSRGSLLLVQPVLVTSLLFAMPVAAHLNHRRVTRSEWTWALLLTLGIALFVVIGHPRPGEHRQAVLGWVIAGVLSLAVVAACVVAAHRTRDRTRAVLLSIAVAVLFALVAVLTKVSVILLERGGPGLLLSRPPLYVLILLAVGATLLQQSAFHAGALQMSLPTMTVLEPIVAVALGVLVLGEHLGVGRVAAGELAVAVIVMVVATAALARDAALHDHPPLPAEPEPEPAEAGVTAE